MSIVTDLAVSSKFAEAYWRALCKQARRTLGDVAGEAVEKSLVWPLEVYASHFAGWRRARDEQGVTAAIATEAAGFTNGIMRGASVLPQWLGDDAPAKCRYLAPATELATKLDAAWTLIEGQWPDAAAEAAALVRGIALVDSNRVFSSTSDPKIFGLIHLDQAFYRDKSIAELATAIVHECGHHALFVATTMDPIIEDPKKILYSPFRDAERPAIGVLHAAMALARMVRWGFMLGRSVGQLDQKFGAVAEVKRISDVLRPKLIKTIAEMEKIEFTTKGLPIRNDLMAAAAL